MLQCEKEYEVAILNSLPTRHQSPASEGLGPVLLPKSWNLIIRPPPLCLPAPNARSLECAVYCSVLMVVDVVEVNVIMGAGMDSLVVDVVEVNVIMGAGGEGAGMHSLVSCFAVNNSNFAVVEVFIRML